MTMFCFYFNWVFLLQVIPGKDSRAAETLCWLHHRLFAAGLNGEITEYDLENLKPRSSVETFGGPVWTIGCNRQGTMLAVGSNPFFSVCSITAPPNISEGVCVFGVCVSQAGCENGTVKIFEVQEEKIQLQRSLERQKGLFVLIKHRPLQA